MIDPAEDWRPIWVNYPRGHRFEAVQLYRDGRPVKRDDGMIRVRYLYHPFSGWIHPRRISPRR